jgi:hypothetical protein
MPAKSKHLPRYGRVSQPPPMRLTPRDMRILETIHAYDGLLSFSQVRRLFFSGKSQAELRLKLLYQNGYLNRPSHTQRLRLPEMIYWLDKRGAELVASLEGASIKEYSWRQEPRWNQVEHDLAVNDFRINLEQACRDNPNVSIVTWVPESEFWAFPDRVEYAYGEGKISRKIRPDGYFLLRAKQHRIRYLLEIDRSTEDNPRFYREKILPGLAYIQSQAYEDRFGHRSGRWLVVTTSERRLGNMLSQARQAKAQGIFYFTTFNQINVDTIINSPIWRRADREDLVPLLFLE